MWAHNLNTTYSHYLSYSIMNAHALAMSSLGRSAPNQHLSTVRTANPHTTMLIAKTPKADITTTRHSRILGDPANNK